MRVLVDADYLAYSCGFASQRVAYDYTVVADEEVIAEGIVSTRDEVEAVAAMRPEGSALFVGTVTEAEPLVNALAMTKRTLLKIESAMDEAGIVFGGLELFLTGKGNFRDEYATLRGYKANRIGFEKPVHHAAIRRYMVNRWGAIVVNGCEADDEVAIQAASLQYDPDRVCIVSCDKDLRTVPGRLYNFKKRSMVILSREEALRNFYRQMLTGDTVDNVAGCYKAGPKKALEIIPDSMMDEAEMYAAVLKEFEESKTRKGCPYSGLDAADVVRETGILLHMQRWPGQVWAPPIIQERP